MRVTVPKDRHGGHKGAIIAFTVLGVLVVLGIWALQVQQMVVKRYGGGVQEDVDATFADIQAGIDYAAEVEENAPLPEDPTGGLWQVLMQSFNKEVVTQKAFHEVAEQLIDDLSTTQEVHATNQEAWEELSQQVEEEIR